MQVTGINITIEMNEGIFIKLLDKNIKFYLDKNQN